MSGAARPGADQKKEAAPKPLSLDEEMARSLRDNPDIRVAEAKVRDAQAELNRVRLQVAQKVTTGHRALEAQRKSAATTERAFQRAARLRKQGSSTDEEIEVADEALARARGKLAELEAEMSYLLGQAPGSSTVKSPSEAGRQLSLQADLMPSTKDGDLRALAAESLLRANENVQKAPSPPRGMAGEKLRRALEAVTSVRFDDEPLLDVLDQVQASSGIAIVKGPSLPDAGVTLQFSAQPWGQVLQALEDVVPKLAFVPREYGLLATSRDSLPPGTLDLQAFLKESAAAEKPAPGAKK
jgi:hypothetical protein